MDGQLQTFQNERGVMDLVKHLERQHEWSQRTFGPGDRTKALCEHIRRELNEIEQDTESLIEWIDVVILAFEGALRIGWSPEVVAECLNKKQLKNERRKWPDWRSADPGKPIEHMRECIEKEVNPITIDTLFRNFRDESAESIYLTHVERLNTKKEPIDVGSKSATAFSEPLRSMTEGRKDDGGKLRYDLLPVDALREVVRVFTFGAGKYEVRNWEKGIRYGRCYAACQRHLNAFWEGETADQESGIHHLAHAAWNALTLLAYELRGMRVFDDRPLEAFNKLLSDMTKERNRGFAERGD